MLIVLRWLKLIILSFITSGCQHRWICYCVYCLCWRIFTICDTKREISGATKKPLNSYCNYYLISLSWIATHNHSKSWMTEQLISHIYVREFMQTWPAFMIVTASLWFNKSQQWPGNVFPGNSYCLHTVSDAMPLFSPLFWLTSVFFSVGMTIMGVWRTSLTRRAEWAATVQMATARSASRQRAPTKRISPSPPTCQPLAPSTRSCRVSVFYRSSWVELVTFKVFYQCYWQKHELCLWFSLN